MASAAEKVTTLERRADVLKQEKHRIQQAIRETAIQGLESLQLGPAGTTAAQPSLSNVPSVLVADLCSLQLCEVQAVQLQELQNLARHLDKQLRSVDRALVEASVHSFVDAVSAAVASCSATVPQCQKLQISLKDGIVQLPQIQQTADNLIARVLNAQSRLRQLVEQEMQTSLAQVGWPPPLTQLMQSSDEHSQETTQNHWSGFKENQEELKHLMTALIRLQQAVEPTAFSKVTDGSEIEGPLLWAVQVLAKPVGERLRLHFASGLPTDRPDKPEWLFATALRMAGALGQYLDVFHTVLESLELENSYAMQLEFARAVKEEVKSILRSHTLPALLHARDAGVWVHMAHQMMEWDAQMAQLQGIMITQDGEPPISSNWAAESCTAVLFEEQEWTAAWFQAELDDASSEVEAVLDSSSGWRPLFDVWGEAQGEEGEDMWELSLSGPTGTSSRSSEHEFWPPICADTLMSRVMAIIRRSRWIGTRHQRKKYLKAVAQELLKSFRARLTRECKNAAAGSRDISVPPRSSAVAAVVCAAHYLEFQLREPELFALLDVDANLTATTNSVAMASPISTNSAASSVTGHSSLANFLERESTGFGWVRKEWTLKLAKAVATAFTDATKSYRTKLDRFGDEVPDLEVTPSVSPGLVTAIKQLQQTLKRLSGQLDSIVFGEVWRAVAVAINRLMFNDIATEARFSQQGMRQLSVDTAALVSVFQQFTPRPAAHFKELNEACKLLALDSAAISTLLPNLTASSSAARAALGNVGVHRLTADQAVAVLAQRLTRN